jgi:hypothetical protein
MVVLRESGLITRLSTKNTPAITRDLCILQIVQLVSIYPMPVALETYSNPAPLVIPIIGEVSIKHRNLESNKIPVA